MEVEAVLLEILERRGQEVSLLAPVSVHKNHLSKYITEMPF
jgi:hypothetical protein